MPALPPRSCEKTTRSCHSERPWASGPPEAMKIRVVPNENQRRPREGGDPWWVGTKMDSRLRGNDVTFAGMTSPGVTFGGVSMGLWPTRGNENPRRPRAGGDPCRVDSRLRGNDVIGAIFRRAKRGIYICLFSRRQMQMLRYAQHDRIRFFHKFFTSGCGTPRSRALWLRSSVRTAGSGSSSNRSGIRCFKKCRL